MRDNKFLKGSQAGMSKPVLCKKCGRGANRGLFTDGRMTAKTGHTTLVKEGDEYICTDCRKKGVFLSRRERRGTA